MELHERVSENIRRLMPRAGFTSRLDLALAAGLDPSNLSGMLTGKKPAGKTTLTRIAKALGVGYFDLIDIGPSRELALAAAPAPVPQCVELAPCLADINEAVKETERLLGKKEALTLAVKALSKQLEELSSASHEAAV